MWREVPVHACAALSSFVRSLVGWLAGGWKGSDHAVSCLVFRFFRSAVSSATIQGRSEEANSARPAYPIEAACVGVSVKGAMPKEGLERANVVLCPSGCKGIVFGKFSNSSSYETVLQSLPYRPSESIDVFVGVVDRLLRHFAFDCVFILPFHTFPETLSPAFVLLLYRFLVASVLTLPGVVFWHKCLIWLRNMQWCARADWKQME